MSLTTVDSLFRLMLIISLGIIYFIGQGWFLVGPVFNGRAFLVRATKPTFQSVALMFICGITINFTLTLLIKSISISFIAGSVVSATGLFSLAYVLSRSRGKWIVSKESILKGVGILSICLLFLFPILTEPLSAWDARSIWFFHAKMIYKANSIGQSAGWLHPSVIFSHPDYPILVSALAAQICNLFGFWNEYVPKLSLFFLLVPTIIWIFSFARRSISFFIYLILMTFGLSPWLWNGYMDGFLAIYFSIGMFFLCRFLISYQGVDLVSGIFSLIFTMNLKNEGVLAVVTGISSLVIFLVLMRKTLLENVKPAKYYPYLLATIFALLPFVIWFFYKQHWGLANDLEIGTKQSFTRLIEKLTDGSFRLILRRSFIAVDFSLLLLFLVFITAVAKKIPISMEILPVLTTIGFYFLGLLAIYLSTPHDLIWHLDTSATRTFLIVNALFYTCAYPILESIERCAVSFDL